MRPWRLEWTPEQVRAFWDWYAEHPSLQSEYCSRFVGHSMLDEIARHIPMSGTVVDLGAGPGFVTEQLLARGIKTYAFDSSRKSVEALQERFGAHPNLLGAAVAEDGIPLADGVADAVLLVETIEHVDEIGGQSLLREVRRVLRPGGYVAMTTPHREDLSRSEIVCPNCQCVFHRMQHLRSFGPAELSATAEKAHFRRILCRATYFSSYQGLHRTLERVRRKLEGSADPHLLFIGQRG